MKLIYIRSVIKNNDTEKCKYMDMFTVTRYMYR